ESEAFRAPRYELRAFTPNESLPAIRASFFSCYRQDLRVIFRRSKTRAPVHARQNPARPQTRPRTKLQKGPTWLRRCQGPQERSRKQVGIHPKLRRSRARENRLVAFGHLNFGVVVHGQKRES